MRNLAWLAACLSVLILTGCPSNTGGSKATPSVDQMQNAMQNPAGKQGAPPEGVESGAAGIPKGNLTTGANAPIVGAKKMPASSGPQGAPTGGTPPAGK